MITAAGDRFWLEGATGQQLWSWRSVGKDGPGRGCHLLQSAICWAGSVIAKSGSGIGFDPLY